jgi:hypothetical protein
MIKRRDSRRLTTPPAARPSPRARSAAAPAVVRWPPPGCAKRDHSGCLRPLKAWATTSPSSTAGAQRRTGLPPQRPGSPQQPPQVRHHCQHKSGAEHAENTFSWLIVGGKGSNRTSDRSDRKAAIPSCAYRSTHLSTLGRDTPAGAATSTRRRPSAIHNTIRARVATAADTSLELTNAHSRRGQPQPDPYLFNDTPDITEPGLRDTRSTPITATMSRSHHDRSMAVEYPLAVQ